MSDKCNMGRPAKPTVRNGGLSVKAHEIDAASLRSAAQAEPAGFASKVQDLVDEGKLRWQNVKNVKSLQDALGDVVIPGVFNQQTRSLISSSSFPLLTSAMTVAGVADAFMAVPSVGQELVTEFDDNKKDTRWVGITSENPITDRVDEGMGAFPLIGAGEESFSISHKRNGRRMVVTQEMIEENDLAGILQRVNALGEIAAELIEKQTIRRVCDIDGSGTSPAEPYVLHVNGAAASYYSTTANTPSTRTPSGLRINNNALVDTSDLEVARVRLATLLNHRLERISLSQSGMILLVPDALWLTAWKLLNSTFEPAVFNEKNFFGDAGAFRPRLLSTAKLDDFTNGATTWYLGDFQGSFVRKWKLRPETVVLPGTSPGAAQSFLDSRIGFQARVAWDCEVGAVDYRVVQSLTNTTAPS